MVSWNKGTIVIGSPRCGSHAYTQSSFVNFRASHKKYLGELFLENRQDSWPEKLAKHPDDYIFFSVVHRFSKVRLISDIDLLKNYYVVSLRRRDKVAQYMSWLIFREFGMKNHSASNAKLHINWSVAQTEDDINLFIEDQLIDYGIPSDEIVYYEDTLEFMKQSYFKKNTYVPFDQCFNQMDIIYQMLSKFKYYD